MSAPRRIRNARKQGFTHIANDALRDPRLSWAAKGLLATMLSFPDDWTYYMKHLETLTRQGRDATRSAMRELIAVGYITRKAAHDASGRLTGWEYSVTDAAPPSDGKAVRRETRPTGNPSDGKAAATNTEGTNTEGTKEESSGQAAATEPPAAGAPLHHHSLEEQPQPQPPSAGADPRSEASLQRFFGRLLPTLLAEAPARATAWPALPLSEIQAAATAATADRTTPGVFATRLKARLDAAAGVTAAANPPLEQRGPATPAEAHARGRAQAAATRASEQAYDQALEAGATPDVAQAAATAAYAAALKRPPDPAAARDASARDAETQANERRRQLAAQAAARGATP